MMIRRTRDSLLLETAALWAKRGTCSRARVGCVISKDGRILVQGYNGAPSGLSHCSHDCTCGFESPVYQAPEFHSPECGFGRSGCTVAVHAESNAIAYAARVGASLRGSEMHSTRVPCTNCAMLIINSGIIRVMYAEDHRDMGGLKLLQDALLQVDRADMITVANIKATTMAGG